MHVDTVREDGDAHQVDSADPQRGGESMDLSSFGVRKPLVHPQPSPHGAYFDDRPAATPGDDEINLAGTDLHVALPHHRSPICQHPGSDLLTQPSEVSSMVHEPVSTGRQ
jgi:hypothetical protein